MGLIGPKIKWGIILTLVAVTGFLFWSNQAAIKKAAQKAQALWQIEQTVSDMESRIEEIEKERAWLLEIVDRHAAGIQEARKEARAAKAKWEDIKNEKAVDEWRNQSVPDAVSDLVRIKADGDKNRNRLPDPAEVLGADQGAGADAGKEK